MANDPCTFPRHGRESGHPRLSFQWQTGRAVLTLADFTVEDIEALEAVRAPESSKAFDEEC